MRGVLYLLVGMVNVFDEGFPSEGEDVENDGGGFLRSLDDKSFDGFVKKKISMHAWVNGVLRNVLKGKTQFGFYVLNSIHSCRKPRLSPASAALFPIPMPFEGIWDLDPKRLGPERRFRLAVQRATTWSSWL